MRKISESKKIEVDISNFECIRLKDIREKVKTQVEHFCSEKNPGLGHYLHYHAWQEEVNNYRAFYLIMDGDEIVLYFSLQMGSTIKCHTKTIGGINYIKDGDIYKILDDKLEVDKCVPVVEIPQFCVNDRYRNKRKSWKIIYKEHQYNVGQYVFYKYIVPIVLESAKMIGFQYLILFCADNEQGDLERYYGTMGFKRMDDMACLRDKYSEKLGQHRIIAKSLKI